MPGWQQRFIHPDLFLQFPFTGMGEGPLGTLQNTDDNERKGEEKKRHLETQLELLSQNECLFAWGVGLSTP